MWGRNETAVQSNSCRVFNARVRRRRSKIWKHICEEWYHFLRYHSSLADSVVFNRNQTKCRTAGHKYAVRDRGKYYYINSNADHAIVADVTGLKKLSADLIVGD